MTIRIQTKLILATLLITILPVFPLYFLINHFYERSIEVGLNPKVENALGAATNLSQALFSEYKADVLTLAERAIDNAKIRAAFSKTGQTDLALLSLSMRFPAYEILALDTAGNVVAEYRSSQEALTPRFRLSEVSGYLQQSETQIIPPGNNPETISAVAPVNENGDRLGFLLVTAAVDSDFVQSSRSVVEVNQMFKTINLFEEDIKQGFILFFFIVYVLIAIFSLVVGYFFSKKITAPLQGLVVGTQKIAAGEWDHRVAYRSNDELGKLVASFNTMIREVKAKQEQVIQLEKMAVWREMARVLAHEIKNPLTPIQLMVQQLKDKYTNENSEYKTLLDECTDIIHDEIQNLQQLVREFSDFARMPELHRTHGDLNELITETSKLYTDVPVSLDLDNHLPKISIDFDKMRRVLINFFENSRHSILEKGSGEIEIETVLQVDAVRLRFTDTGNGIADDLQAKVFEPYFSTKKSGMGLGLAIVKRIIEEHGGSIACESAIGEGTTFEIRLPV